MNKTAFTLFLTFTLFAAEGCSYLTSQGRREAAYARYVRRSSAGRVKMQHKFASFPKLPSSPPVTEPQTATSAGPESVTAANE